MGSRPTEQVPVAGRVDSHGCLVAADAALERLQVEAGSALGRPLALPQLAALAKAAASLRLPLSRALVAADASQDLDLLVRAVPDGEEVALTIERWAARPAAPPRLAVVQPIADAPVEEADSPPMFRTNASLLVTEASPALAELAGREPAQCVGVPLTSLFRLVEAEDGAMPLLSSVADRSPVEGQKAAVRGGSEREVIIDAEVLLDSEGQFDGLVGSLRGEGQRLAPLQALDESLDQALRSPLDRIIEAADRIVERSEGPLRSDYASYAGDIAAAGRHLLSVIRGLGAPGARPPQSSQVDLAALAGEAAALVQPIARDRDVRIDIRRPESACAAAGEGRAIVQILVNLVGNAVRHSPAGALVELGFGHDAGTGRCSVIVTDNGPGIAAADQQRIFERYEQAGNPADGTGLGLAISRRLARSLGGDIALVSRPGEGATFTLTLPSA